ncbi:MAG: hypothetical protein MZW92_19775 [Comamonadaceae bacterium]|nr:hypothetical protein [Comamonadaceae bacterium]
MTERLTKRSKDLKMKIVNAVMDGESYSYGMGNDHQVSRRTRVPLCMAASRLTLNEEGRIIQQRDYYDLWGDIFDNIPRFGKAYRKFMIKEVRLN